MHKIDGTKLLLESKLKVINKELKRYKSLSDIFLQAEASNKIFRYGKAYYLSNYLQDPDHNVSDFLKSFLYLKNTEHQLINLKEFFTKEVLKRTDE